MSDIYAMQRANGDVFALDHHRRFRVPLFNSSRDAMIARSRNLEMLLFKPVALNARLLRELVPTGGGSEIDFWLVNDPLINLNRGSLIEHAELALLMNSANQRQTVPRNGNGFHRSILDTLNQSDRDATETWDDEGGQVQRLIHEL
jgi:hypothetical protein